MKILAFFILLMAVSVAGVAQSTLPLRADTVTIEKIGGNATLKIKNPTRDSTGGVLYNIGSGATGFKKSRKITDTSFTVGGDTIAIKGAQNLQQVTDVGNTTTDTIISNGIRTPVLLPDTSNDTPFEFIILPDMQEANENNPTAFTDAFQYILDNQVASNIKAVLTVGDITDNANGTELTRAENAFSDLDNANIPNLPVMGNHDYDGGNISGGVRGVTQWNSYFPPSRFTGLPWWGGNLGSTTENYYIKFDVGGYKFLAIGLEFIPKNASLTWAQGVIDANQDRKVIIATHAYMSTYGERARDTSLFGPNAYGLGADNSGQEMWEKLIKKNKNIVLVFGGHYIHVPWTEGHLKRMADASDSGNVVQQIIVNYQQHLTAPNLSGADGYIMRFRINPATSKATISMYSPFLGTYDPVMDSFDIDLSPIKVDGGLSIKNGLYVAGESVFDGAVYARTIPQDRLIVTKLNGRLDSIPYQTANTVLAGPSTGSAANPTFRVLVAADIPTGSGSYIQNQTAVIQNANFKISGNGWIGNTTSSTAKLSVYGNPFSPQLATGPLLSNSIYTTFHSIDTATSANLSSAMLRGAQLQFDRRYLDDGLTVADNRAAAFTNVPRIRNSITFTNNNGAAVGGADNGFLVRQYGNFIGNSTITGPTTPENAVFGTVSRVEVFNSFIGSNKINATGWYSSYNAYMSTNIGDTMENYISYNTGQRSSFGTVKNVYHHYISGAIGTVSNWGIYQVDAGVKNYFNGTTLFGTTTDDGVNKVQVNGTVKANSFVTSEYKIYTALVSQSGTSSPTATVLGQNTVGTIVWTRNGEGDYTGTLSGAFTANKTFFRVTASDETGTVASARAYRLTANTIALKTDDGTTFPLDNFTNISVEIKVYP